MKRLYITTVIIKKNKDKAHSKSESKTSKNRKSKNNKSTSK